MFMKRNGVTEDGGEEERRNLVSRRGLKETRDAMIGVNSEGAIGVGREVKGGDGSRPTRPAAASYFGHRLSRRGQTTATARRTRHARPRPPTESHTPVTHFLKSVIGWTAQEHELNSADRRLEVTRCADLSTARSPDQPISRLLARAGPHSPASVIGGLETRDEGDWVACGAIRAAFRLVGDHKIRFICSGGQETPHPPAGRS